MNGQGDLAKGWLNKADSDLATARLVLAGPGPYDTACFHAQQAIEKALKSVLAFHGEPIPRTHNLEDIAALVNQVVSDPGNRFDLNALSEVTPFAVELRYDSSFWPDRETAREALAVAEQVRRRVEDLLPPPARP